MHAFDLGCIAYQNAFEIQQKAQSFVLQGGDDILLLLEHPPTVTMGKNSGQENLPPNLDALWGAAVDVVHSTRGGNITCHFPGQLVAYPVINLKKRQGGVRAYVHDVEETAIRTVRHFGIEARRNPGFPGVWVHGCKIASLGIAVHRYVTMHGLAMNVDRDLSLFNIITPCGLAGVAATSVQREQSGAPAVMPDVKRRFLAAFCEVFDQRQPPLQDAAACAELLADQPQPAPEPPAKFQEQHNPQ